VRATVFYILSLIVSQSSNADESSEIAAQDFHEGRHLLEVGYTNIDGFDGDVQVLATSYTFSYSRNLRFSAKTHLIELDAPPDSNGIYISAVSLVTCIFKVYTCKIKACSFKN
jgi:hypothetical protein